MSKMDFVLDFELSGNNLLFGVNQITRTGITLQNLNTSFYDKVNALLATMERLKKLHCLSCPSLKKK